MNNETFVDYYELLELSPRANSSTIEMVARFLANRFQQQTKPPKDKTIFSRFVAAYKTLSNPESRAVYDRLHARQRQRNSELVQVSKDALDPASNRLELLKLFYAQRRRDIKNPGVGFNTLEQLVDAPEEVLAFHVWYFRQKGWVQREESGLMSITAEGVDQIEAHFESQSRAP